MIELFPRTIDSRYHLHRERKYWLLQEKQHDIRLLSPSRQSFGFSLDDPDPENVPLAFFGRRPPKYITKMCDGMVAVLRRDQLYLFAVEIKTADKGDANRQLVNGRLFWRWLMSLYRRHGCLPGTVNVFHVGLLVWQPKQKVRQRGIVTLPKSGNLKKAPTIDGFDACFEAKNLVDIPLAALISQC